MGDTEQKANGETEEKEEENMESVESAEEEKGKEASASVSSEEAAIREKELMEDLLATMLEDEDVAIFSQEESEEEDIDMANATPTLSPSDTNHRVLNEAWNE